MSKMTIKRVLLRLAGVGALWVLGVVLLLGSAPVLMSPSWRSTIDALGSPHAILQLQVIFALGVCSLGVGLFVLAKPLSRRRKQI